MRKVQRQRLQAGADAIVKIALLENESPMEIPQGAHLEVTIYNRLCQPVYEATVENLQLKLTGYYVASCRIPAEVSLPWGGTDVKLYLKMRTANGYTNVASPITLEMLPLP